MKYILYFFFSFWLQTRDEWLTCKYCGNAIWIRVFERKYTISFKPHNTAFSFHLIFYHLHGYCTARSILTPKTLRSLDGALSQRDTSYASSDSHSHAHGFKLWDAIWIPSFWPWTRDEFWPSWTRDEWLILDCLKNAWTEELIICFSVPQYCF